MYASLQSHKLYFSMEFLNDIWLLVLHIPRELSFISTQFFVLDWFGVMSNKFIVFWFSIIILLYYSLIINNPMSFFWKFIFFFPYFSIKSCIFCFTFNCLWTTLWCRSSDLWSIGNFIANQITDCFCWFFELPFLKQF